MYASFASRRKENPLARALQCLPFLLLSVPSVLTAWRAFCSYWWQCWWALTPVSLWKICDHDQLTLQEKVLLVFVDSSGTYDYLMLKESYEYETNGTASLCFISSHYYANCFPPFLISTSFPFFALCCLLVKFFPLNQCNRQDLKL